MRIILANDSLPLLVRGLDLVVERSNEVVDGPGEATMLVHEPRQTVEFPELGEQLFVLRVVPPEDQATFS